MVVRKLGGPTDGCELVGRTLSYDGTALGAAVMLTTGACEPVAPRILVQPTEDAIEFAHTLHARTGGVEAVRWVFEGPTDRPGPISHVDALELFATRDWVPRAAWTGPELSIPRGGAALLRVAIAEGRHADLLAPNGDDFNWLRAGGRSWLMVRNGQGSRLLPISESGHRAGLPTPTIVPPTAAPGSIRIAIDGANGAAIWREGDRIVWRRLACHD